MVYLNGNDGLDSAWLSDGEYSLRLQMQELGYGVLKQPAMYKVVSQSSLDGDTLLAQRIAESQSRSHTELYKREMQATADDRALTVRIAVSEMERLSREDPALADAARDFEEDLTVDDAVLA